MTVTGSQATGNEDVWVPTIPKEVEAISRTEDSLPSAD